MTRVIASSGSHVVCAITTSVGASDGPTGFTSRLQCPSLVRTDPRAVAEHPNATHRSSMSPTSVAA